MGAIVTGAKYYGCNRVVAGTINRGCSSRGCNSRGCNSQGATIADSIVVGSTVSIPNNARQNEDISPLTGASQK